MDDLHAIADEANARFTALESNPAYAGHLGKVKLSREVLQWAEQTFGADVTVASSMGDEVLVELIAQSAPSLDVFFLDTGYHFAETLSVRAMAGEAELRAVAPQPSRRRRVKVPVS